MSVLFVNNSEISFLSYPVGDLGVTYAIYPYLIAKLVVDFLWVIIEHFSLALMAVALRAKIRRNRLLLKGWVSFEAKY